VLGADLLVRSAVSCDGCCRRNRDRSYRRLRGRHGGGIHWCDGTAVLTVGAEWDFTASVDCVIASTSLDRALAGKIVDDAQCFFRSMCVLVRAW